MVVIIHKTVSVNYSIQLFCDLLKPIQKFNKDWNHSFYRTSAGAELDLVLNKGTKLIGVEIKASTSPKLTKGFWNSIEDLSLKEVYVIAPVNDSYPVHKNVTVTSLSKFLKQYY
jgi:predicted AAA+ superfamily ATPase